MGLFNFGNMMSNSMGGQRKVIENCQWDYEVGLIQQDVPDRNKMKILGKTFYTSSYLCPKCGKHMLKANAGEFVAVHTKNGIHTLKSVFACEGCKNLYSALPGKQLSSGVYYIMKDKSKFDMVVDTIDTYGISLEQLQRMGW